MNISGSLTSFDTSVLIALTTLTFLLTHMIAAQIVCVGAAKLSEMETVKVFLQELFDEVTNRRIDESSSRDGMEWSGMERKGVSQIQHQHHSKLRTKILRSAQQTSLNPAGRTVALKKQRSKKLLCAC